MKIRFSLLTLSLIFITTVQAQNFITKNGKITFFSKTMLENIDAVNNQVVSVLNTSSGDIGFSVIIKGFQFKKALMQEHFNDKYMQSDSFPNAKFKGSIADIQKVNFNKDGAYPVKVSGDLTMHGVTKKVSVDGTINIKSRNVNATAEFVVLLADYNIKVQKIAEVSISPRIRIDVDCNYDPKN